MRKKEETKLTPRIYSRDEHIVSRKNIDPDALKIMRRLMQNGYKAYLVGGAVRDLLLGKKPKDFDIATDATPRRVKSLFRNCRIIGRRFKLAHIYFGSGKIFEVSTFRANHDEITQDELTSEEIDDKDLILTDDNVYGDEVSDALRRDITINALFYSLKNFSIIDYSGGFEDLKAGIVRVIGDPEIRFIEDPVRMLRAVRHAVRAGFKLDDNCLKAIADRHHLIDQCSAPRLYEEVRKDLVSGYLLEIFQQYVKTGILQHLLPELVERSDELLQNKTLCARCIDRIDAYALSTGFSSTTLIFAVFAYFLATGDSENPVISERFADRDEIFDFTQSCFSRLVVPKKEKEYIANILDNIRNLENPTIPPAIMNKILRNASCEDTKKVLEFLNVDQRVQGLLEKLETVPETVKTRRHNKGGARMPFYRQRGRH